MYRVAYDAMFVLCVYPFGRPSSSLVSVCICAVRKCGSNVDFHEQIAHMRDAFYVMTAGALALFFGIVKAR